MAPPTATETVTQTEAQKPAVITVSSQEVKKNDQWVEDVHYLAGRAYNRRGMQIRILLSA